ncbi:TonB-dependent receptor [Parabacteroides sp. PF5-9]|uniref:TonB-dependent receptor plug domain-containing protein n=1 Tax=Parabacteroides sp. PF5-9 TaxID=1742404 RepID=UPI002473A48F|nr:TonB-dependent receptor [Parabacteroides sp. PF5-9]MDH6356528.1 vitamin B12 transporter [Parabacteroides sp. PF5-9]
MKKKRFYGKDVFRFKRFARKAYSAFNSMHKVVNIGVITGCVLTIVPTMGVWAQTSEEQQKTPEMVEQEIEEVMVTASRVAMPINQTAKLVTVVTQEQIEQAPVQSLQDLLIYTANIDVVQRAGHGVQSDISIRGGSKDQTAILLNGVNLSNSHTGVYSLDIPFNLSDIERIEIIHGPSALIYGASAFAGGINIITKKNVNSKGYARVEGGMHNLRALEVRGAAKWGIATTSLSAGHNSSDGYTDNTDYNLYNLLGQTRLQFKENSKVDINLGYNDKKYGANSFYTAKFPHQYDHTSRYLGTLKGEFGSKLKFIPIIYWFRHYDTFELNRGTENGKNYHRGDTYGTNLIMQYESKLGHTSIGTEIRREDIISNVLGKPMAEPHGHFKNYDDRLNTSVTLEHTAKLEHFVLSLGALMNHNTLEKGKYKFYPSASVAYRPNYKINIYTTWGNSTRMPSFTELYYTTETHDSNDNLLPERSQSVDLGFKYKDAFVSAYLTGFLMWGRNIIDWVRVEKEDGRTVSASWNHTKLNTQGVELGLRFRLAEIWPVLGEQTALSLDYARMNQDCDTNGQNSLYKLNYLRDKFTATFNHRIYKAFSAGWYFRYQKRMGMYDAYEDGLDIGRTPYRAFSTLDLRLNYHYQDIALHLNLNNLYDTRHNDMGNIPQPGFWLTGGVSYTFK